MQDYLIYFIAGFGLVGGWVITREFFCARQRRRERHTPHLLIEYDADGALALIAILQLHVKHAPYMATDPQIDGRNLCGFARAATAGLIEMLRQAGYAEHVRRAEHDPGSARVQ